MSKNNTNEMLDDVGLDIPVVSVPNGGFTHKAELFEEIKHPKQFSTIVDILNTASELDYFILHLSSGGGCVESVERLAYAIENSRAHVHVVATGSNDSSATRLMIVADSIEMSDDVTSLIHAGSIMNGGEFKEYRDHGNFLNKHHEDTLRRWYKDILTEDEINKVLNNSGISLNKRMWMERLKRREEARIEEFELDNELFSFEESPKKKIVH